MKKGDHQTRSAKRARRALELEVVTLQPKLVALQQKVVVL
jgi:hypothetical protein